jgi:hypothetical protein
MIVIELHYTPFVYQLVPASSFVLCAWGRAMAPDDCLDGL